MATASDVLRVAAGEIGHKGGGKYWQAMGYSYTDKTAPAWCCVGLNWVFTQCGMGLDRRAMNCGRLRPYGIQWALSAAGASQVLDTAKAQAGDVLVFRWSGGSSTSFDHVGLCELNRGSYYQTIEFNVSDSVGRRTRAYSTVAAVWRPAYTSASKSSAYVAREVINGQWGMGKERETRLTNAGYSYEKVQSIVNLILGGTVSQLAQMVIAGEFGTGNERKYILGSRYESVQNKVNSFLSK